MSTRAAPEWYVITHYGWRNFYLSIFPNAISLRPVDGPDAPKGIPWVNIIILTCNTCSELYLKISCRGKSCDKSSRNSL